MLVASMYLVFASFMPTHPVPIQDSPKNPQTSAASLATSLSSKAMIEMASLFLDSILTIIDKDQPIAGRQSAAEVVREKIGNLTPESKSTMAGLCKFATQYKKNPKMWRALLPSGDKLGMTTDQLSALVEKVCIFRTKFGDSLIETENPHP